MMIFPPLQSIANCFRVPLSNKVGFLFHLRRFIIRCHSEARQLIKKSVPFFSDTEMEKYSDVSFSLSILFAYPIVFNLRVENDRENDKSGSSKYFFFPEVIGHGLGLAS